VTRVSDSEASAGAAIATAAPDAVAEVAGAIDAKEQVAAIGPTVKAPPVTRSKWYRLRRDGAALVNYLLDSEVHTYAFSVAANAILSFIPFIVLLIPSRCRCCIPRPWPMW
jgi:hypothetical protein